MAFNNPIYSLSPREEYRFLVGSVIESHVPNKVVKVFVNLAFTILSTYYYFIKTTVGKRNLYDLFIHLPQKCSCKIL